MTEVTKVLLFGVDNPEKPEDTPKPEDNQKPEDKPAKDEHMIPKSRFDEVNSKAKELEQRLQAIEAERKEQELNSKKEQGEFKELYEQALAELDSAKNAKERAEALEGVIESLVQSKLESVPEEYHDLIPEGLSAEQKLKWLSTAEQKGLFKKTNPKQSEALGKPTNGGAEEPVDVSKMSAHELFLSAFGGKDK